MGGWVSYLSCSHIHICNSHGHIQSNHEKNIQLTQVEERSTKHLNSTPQDCQGHQTQGKSEKLEDPKETG